MDPDLVGFEARFVGTYFLAYAVGIVLHETGHAVVGWALDCRPRIIEIGWGPPVFRCRLKGAWLVIRLLPVSGMVYLLPRGRDRLRDSFLVTAAGPLANVVIAAIAFAPMAVRGFSFDAVALGFPWLFAQGWILLLVLWPRTYRKQGARFETDGHKLWRYATHRGDDAYVAMHRNVLRRVVPEGEPVPSPSPHFAELVVQAVRRDRLKESWARADAIATVRAVLAEDLPDGERAWARLFLAELETEATTAAPKPASAAVV